MIQLWFILTQKSKSLIFFLKERGIIDSITIIITSNHGEEFWKYVIVEIFFYNPNETIGVGHCS